MITSLLSRSVQFPLPANVQQTPQRARDSISDESWYLSVRFYQALCGATARHAYICQFRFDPHHYPTRRAAGKVGVHSLNFYSMNFTPITKVVPETRNLGERATVRTSTHQTLLLSSPMPFQNFKAFKSR